ncbi:MAG: hypothetical protein C0456_13910 [Hyphomonas sp.]|uniref:head-tail connector protein n=1 Tax=Hyphomonas sp. TaxID=87 RepID=UPI001D479CFB|nr:phage head-tail connector protein [Hyphomonas sp.]MBA4227718.1 hypothetical protein [Hyphomonas sp.]
MSDLTVITPPAGEPVSLDAAKEFLRLATDAEDGLVARLIASARAQIEAASGLALVSRTCRRTWRRWPWAIVHGGTRLRPGPAGALVSVARFDAVGTEEPLTGRFEICGGKLRLKAGEAVPGIAPGGRVEVTFEAGFGAAGDVPEDLQHAVKLYVQAAYLRGSERPLSGVPEDVQAILDARREWAI